MKDLHTAPDEHLEARITAWVLGEASPFEAAELEALCAEDPSLQVFVNRTRALHSLLLETPPSSSDQFWKLSPERRTKLDPIIGPSTATHSNKNSSVRRAAYRTFFGIAAVLTVTLFIKRFIFTPLSDEKTAMTIVGGSEFKMELSERERQLPQIRGMILDEAPEDIVAEKKSFRSISSSASKKPSAPSASTPAPTVEHSIAMSDGDKDLRFSGSEGTELIARSKNMRLKGQELNDLDLYGKDEAAPSKSETLAHNTQEINIPVPNVDPSKLSTTAGKEEVNDGGIGYGSGHGGRHSDMSNTALAQSDKFESDNALNKGGFRYEQKSIEAKRSEQFKNIEIAGNIRADKGRELEDLKPTDGFIGTNQKGNISSGNRSSDIAIESKSIDAVLNNPNSTATADNGAGLGISFSESGLAQREIARRQNSVKEADESLIDGREDYAKGDYSGAIDKYKAALSNVKDVPALADRRDSYSQHLSDASIAQAQQFRKVGKYDEARNLLQEAEVLSPFDARINQELAYLEDPIRTNPALTYEHTKEVDDVRRKLYMGQGNYDLGKYDDAKKSYEDALRIDPHNEAARRGMEKIAATKSDYYRAAYDHTRAELLMEVDKAWELAVPAEGEEEGGKELAANSVNQSSATLQSGKNKDISIIREFTYPTEYEAPSDSPSDSNGYFRQLTIPTSDKGKELFEAGPSADPFAAPAVSGPSADPFAAPPATRAGEELANSDFEGFINYGSPILGATSANDPKSVKIATKFIEITQDQQDELGFDWIEAPFQNNDFDIKLRAGAERIQTPIFPVTPATPTFESHLTGFTGEVVPILGDLPAIGRLFSDSEKKEAEQEISKGTKYGFFFRGSELGEMQKPSLVDLSNELSTTQEIFSTFSLNISDASFQIARAALERGERPDPTSIKPEQFYNAVDYGDPAPSASEPVAAAIDQTAHPVIPGRNLVRVALRTASTGRSEAQPLRLTLLVDQSGSMVRGDRRVAMETALTQLATLLTANDQITVIGFSRTPHLLVESLPGNEAAKLPEIINQTASEGGTNLEQAINLATDLATRHQLNGAQNRIVLFTDGAANLGDADPERLSEKIENLRQQGLAFDIAGIGTNDLNDRLLSDLARHGNGRYYLVGEKTGGNFAAQLAGAFRPAAENVKVQVKLNPQRVGNYKLIGFEKDRLKTEDFHNDAVDAAELAADEAGVALYQVETLPQGTGEIGEVSVRFRDTASGEMVERKWTIPYDASTPSFDKANPKTQLATLALMAAQKLQTGPLADAIDFSNYSETIAKLKQANAKSEKTQQLISLINSLK